MNTVKFCCTHLSPTTVSFSCMHPSPSFCCVPPFEVQIVSSTPRSPLDQASRPYKRSVHITVFGVQNLALLHVDVPQTDILSSWRSHNWQQLDNCDEANFIIMTESDGSRASSNLTVAVCDDEACGTLWIAQICFGKISTFFFVFTGDSSCSLALFCHVQLIFQYYFYNLKLLVYLKQKTNSLSWALFSLSETKFPAF